MPVANAQVLTYLVGGNILRDAHCVKQSLGTGPVGVSAMVVAWRVKLSIVAAREYSAVPTYAATLRHASWHLTCRSLILPLSSLDL